MKTDIDFNIPAYLTLITKEEGGEKKRYFRTTASSTVEDAHGDEFTSKAVEKMARQANGSGMSIFLNHEYRIPEDLFGTTTEAVAVKRQAGSEMVTDFDLIGFINEANPRARETAESLEGGAKLGVSIGARIKDYRPKDKKDPLGGWIIDDVELKETSIVGMPANPRTWVHYAAKAVTAFDRKKVKEAVDMEKKTAAAVADLPNDESITEDGDEVEQMLDAQKVFTTENIPGNQPAEAVDGEDEGQPTFDATETEDDVPAEGDAAEEPTPDKESPVAVTASETPPSTPSDALSSSVEDLSVAALKSALQTAKDEITSRDEEITTLKTERDVALATLATATAIVETIANKPLGRKASFQPEIDDYRQRIGGLYNEEFRKFLKGSTPQ